MIKPTKRRAFNFLRSYFDVLNELKTDSDKLNFLTSIIEKQFLGENPKDLNFIVNLCYESQRHQIESSVKGWERASKDTLSTTPPTDPLTPSKEEEEEEEVEEKEEYTQLNWGGLISYFNKITKKKTKVVPKKAKQQIEARLKDGYTKEDLAKAIINCSKDQYHIDNNLKYLTYEFISRADKFEKYATMPTAKKSNAWEW